MEVKIGVVLKRLMKEKKFSVKALSKESGVPISTIHEWQNGRSPRNVVQARKVADVLGISLNHLLFDEEEKLEVISLNSLIKDDVFSGIFEISIKRVRNKDS